MSTNYDINRIANGKIADASKSILSYCLSRTSSQHDVEDLSQDIFEGILTNNNKVINIFLDIARKNTENFCENDR